MSRLLPDVEPIKREPLATEIARRLVDYLLSGGVEPGARMPSERQLAEAFGVGRSAMREALKALTLLGLVEVRHGDGTYLKRDDTALLSQVIEWGLLLGEQRTLDLVEARQKVEADIAGLAALRRDEADLIELRRLLARMEQLSRVSGSPGEFVDADVAFHLRVAEASRNTALRDILSGIQALLRVWIGRVIAAGNREAPTRSTSRFWRRLRRATSWPPKRRWRPTCGRPRAAWNRRWRRRRPAGSRRAGGAPPAMSSIRRWATAKESAVGEPLVRAPIGDETLGVCDRVPVFCKGRVSREFARGEATKADVMHWVAGGVVPIVEAVEDEYPDFVEPAVNE